MAGAGWGQVLAAGVNGYLKGQQIVAARDGDAADKEYRDEARARQRKEWADSDAIQADLKAASAPVTAVEGAGGAVLPETMDNRDVGQPGEAPLASQGAYRVGAKTFADPAAAQAAVTAANDPAAVAGRQAQAYQSRGMPEKAAALEAKQATLVKQAQEYKEKGLFEGLKQFRSGNLNGTLSALKSSGMYSPTGDVSMEPTTTELPGVGKVKSYNLTFQNKNPDGTTAPVTLNSHELSMQAMPYEKQLETLGKGLEREDKSVDRQERRDTSKLIAAATVALKTAQADRAERTPVGRGGGGGGSGEKADRETRLRLQTLSSQVSTQIREIDSALKEETKESIPGRPPSPRAQELVRQRADLATQRTDLHEELNSLPRSSSGIAAERAAQRPQTEKTGRGELQKITTKDQYDKLPTGAVYIAPNGQQMKKK